MKTKPNHEPHHRKRPPLICRPAGASEFVLDTMDYKHVAPLALVCEFARRVAAVERLKTAHRASLAELDALFATLQHRAFRGEI